MRSAPLLVILALALGPGLARADDPDRQIAVTGTGEAAASPDMATLRAGVSTRARTAAAAMSANSGRLGKVIAAIEEAGVAARDVQTTGLGLRPDRRNTEDGPKLVGYVAENGVTVRLRDLDRLATLLDAVVTDGANRLDGISFGLAKPAALEAKARRRAVKDAKMRAATYADAAGVRVGEVVSIRESGGGGGPRPMAMAASVRSGSVPIAEGQVTESATVEMVFAIAGSEE